MKKKSFNGASLAISSYEIIGVINDEKLFGGEIKCPFEKTPIKL